ncbi:glycosyltransferase family 2 protein [Nonomuraea sp. MG754425]|uniref:glycosyltransferase family 2 protein n=1 Tax=Nonomuraea sp. MG754425 TaxID=2570319 RepID=UPI001F3E3ACD|nr:glycosyltransferase [Nonomuraea sp. MG754425]MCF6473402.1 glycosyltransferase family 2 protein [Nonomuraea sp. MG754425]
MSRPNISVVIPVFQRPVELGRTLRSLRGQSMVPERFEVIVVNDGDASTLGEEAVRTGSGLPGFRVIQNERNMGVAGARNAGARVASGEVLLFLDVDCMAGENLLTAHHEAQLRRPMAACGNTFGREWVPDVWRVHYGEEWPWDDAPAALAAASADAVLRDPLEDLLADPSPLDWAFFWTTNVSVPRDVFTAVGGFHEAFDVKGVEDMELGRRLAHAGLPITFLPDARALHQPHERDRLKELRRDRRNEETLLSLHPFLDTEAICAFDSVNAKRMYAALLRFAARIPSRSMDCAHLPSLPVVVERLRSGPTVLLLGDPSGWPADLSPPATVVHPGRHPAEAGRLALLGVKLPLRSQSHDLAIVTDYWRHFPERTLTRVLKEAARCAKQVLLLSGVSTDPAPWPDAELSAALAAGDRPFWEWAVSVPRELHQFCFSAFDEGFSASEQGGWALRARAMDVRVRAGRPDERRPGRADERGGPVTCG